MPKCSRKDCSELATQTVRMRLCNDDGQIAEVFATIHACCENHQAPDEDIARFFKANWERITTGFQLLKQQLPILEKTEFAWVPTEQYEEFVRAQLAENRRNKTDIKVN